MRHPVNSNRVSKQRPGAALRHGLSVILLLALTVSLAGCGSRKTATPTPSLTPAASATPTPTRPANTEVILATTTSTADTGLLDALLPMFESKTGYKVKPIAVGSGQAIALGERGEADVLLAHSPAAEIAFMQAGHGISRRLVMHNYFIIVGPATDPAGIKGMTSAVEALKKIAAAKAIFISRGDKSGTDTTEKALWAQAGITVAGQSWYQETGQGMGATLTITSEKRGYTLSDRGTYLKTKQNLGLTVLAEGDPILVNVYHVIQVNPLRSPRVNAAGAKAFSDFILDPATQKFISTFGVDQYGEAFFIPNAGKTEAELGSK